MSESFNASAITHIYLSRSEVVENMDTARESVRKDISLLFAQFRLEAARMGFMVDLDTEKLTVC